MACGSLRPNGRGGWGAENARTGRAVADLTVANQASGGSGRRGPCAPDASAEGRHADRCVR